jgi:hypothetical protein
MTPTAVPLAKAAETIGTDRQTLRAVCNRLGFRDRQSDGQRVIPAEVVQLFAQTRQYSGYFHPRSINTRDALLRAASELTRPPQASPAGHAA